MELRNITEIAAANTFLTEHFIDEHNRRFAIKPQGAHRAWRTIPGDMDLTRTISFHYQAVVGNDNAVRLGGMVIDIPEGPRNRGYAKAKVEVRQLLDGRWRVYHQDTLIAQTDPTPLKEPIRARPRKKSTARAASEDQWVYMASAVRGDIFVAQ
jgi:hypothetical protein